MLQDGKIVVSTSKKRKKVARGPLAGSFQNTREVVYKTVVGKTKKGPLYSSETRHELV